MNGIGSFDERRCVCSWTESVCRISTYGGIMDSIIESMCICQRVLTVSYNLIPENNWLIHNKMNIVNVM